MCKILNDVDEVIKNKSERFYFFSVERINWINWIDLITPCCCLASCSKGAPGLVLEAKAFTGFGMCGIFPKMWENKACLSSKADVGGGDKWKPSGSDSHWRACAPNTNQRAYLLSVGESKLGCVVQSNIGFHMFGFYCSEIGTSKNCNDLVTFSRDNTVKQYYFWQNSMLSHSYVLVNLLQFLTYLSQMPEISEQNKIIFCWKELSPGSPPNLLSCWQTQCCTTWSQETRMKRTMKKRWSIGKASGCFLWRGKVVSLKYDSKCDFILNNFVSIAGSAA